MEHASGYLQTVDGLHPALACQWFLHLPEVVHHFPQKARHLLSAREILKQARAAKLVETSSQSKADTMETLRVTCQKRHYPLQARKKCCQVKHTGTTLTRHFRQELIPLSWYRLDFSFRSGNVVFLHCISYEYQHLYICLHRTYHCLVAWCCGCRSSGFLHQEPRAVKCFLFFFKSGIGLNKASIASLAARSSAS